MPTEKYRLTERNIKSAKYQGSKNTRFVIWDENPASPPGFGLRIYPSGRKAFVFTYRNADRKVRMKTIRDWVPNMDTLSEARAEASEMRLAIRDGEDPIAQDEAQKDAETMRDLVDAFVADYARRNRKSWEKDKRRLHRAILADREDNKKPPADWSNRKVHGIAHRDVQRLHRELRDPPYEANRVLSLLHVVFEWAKKQRFIDREAVNPAADVDPYKEKSRDRVVERDEMPALWQAIGEESSPYVECYFKLLILTGQRKNELMRAKWEHVDLEQRHLLIPQTKSDRPNLVPLADGALAILDQIPRIKSNPHIFCGRVDGQPLKTVDRRWHRLGKKRKDGTRKLYGIRNRAGLEGLRIHDLRHTAGWWIANELGYSELVVRSFLGHAIPGITGTYVDARTRKVPKEVRNASDEYAADILATVGELGENVVSIHGGAS